MLLARLLCNRNDSLAWACLLCLAPGIGPDFRMKTYERARAARTTFAAALLATHPDALQGAAAGVARKARALIDEKIAWLDEHPPPNGLDVDNWGDWLGDAFTANAPAQISQDLDQLLSIVDAEAGVGLSLDRYLSQIQPLAKDHAAASASGVRFMSMAMSKGLTVEASIIIGAEEGIVPYPDADEDEERRLLYVAMTRARRHSFVTMARRRTGPTARSGSGEVQARRRRTRFLERGHVGVQDGAEYIKGRWPAAGGNAATAA
jgi:superfamily I DNA/RNA helicase